jgi:hypothetical protein
MEQPEGVIRILRDVIVERSRDNEWIAISLEAAVVGETLVLDFWEGESRRSITVRVLESRPVIVDGDVRHRIRLHADPPPPILDEQQIRRG